MSRSATPDTCAALSSLHLHCRTHVCMVPSNRGQASFSHPDSKPQFRLRECGLAHCSLTYFVNEARLADGAPSGGGNVRYATRRLRDEGIVFGLSVLSDIPAGAELLANYDDRQAPAMVSTRRGAPA